MKKYVRLRVIALALAALAGILLYLLAAASGNTSLFARHYPLLLGLNGAVAAGFFFLVLWQLRRLWRELRQRVFGARLKMRLMLMFALVAVVPGALVYSVSVSFVTSSIESWFDVRVDRALEGGLNLGRNALDYLLADLKAKGRTLALELAAQPEVQQRLALDRLREQAGVAQAALFAGNGTLIANAGGFDKKFEGGFGGLPASPPSSLLRQGRGSGYAAVEGDGDGSLVLRVLLPVAPHDLAGEARILQLLHPVPADLAQSAESVQEVYRDYQELQLARRGLKRIYGITLTLALLLALFAAMAWAFILARRLAAPLLILAEGTEAVAQGDFSPRAALPARDELGVLTHSFNSMTRQLDEARAQAERHRNEVEAAHAHLESILANLSAGVLAFDRGFILRAVNPGARAILGDDFQGLAGRHPDDWPRQRELGEAVRCEFGEHPDIAWSLEIELPHPGGAAQTLLLRGSALPEPEGGFVLVFDDITRLVAAQRAAAWGEVARRLAHEIKNPLTPIQLSAERLRHKLADRLQGADRDMLERATQTIVNQVATMKDMVNEFRDYARMPPPKIAATDLNAVVAEVLTLYESATARPQADLAPDLPPVLGDAAQLRQVVHNLLRNAEDALAGREAAQQRVETRHEDGLALLAVEDDGPGFPPEVLARAFEPYVTTKARGTGLGLAIVRKIIDEHHGRIELGNIEPHGARIRIALPLAAREAT